MFKAGMGMLLYAFLCTNVCAQTVLKGHVSDAADHTAIPGATVTVTEYRSGAVTDINGNFSIANLPAKMLLLRIQAVGYTPVQLNVNPVADSILTITLKTTTIEAGEVVVTGSAFTTESDKNSLPVVPIERRKLLQYGAGNFADGLTQVAGVTSVSTGNSISKPVIRGLGYNRIVTIEAGLRQEGQQWGDEHGLEIDQFNADRVEIVKGPASLLYGSDALGGVINILEPLPAPSGVIRGEVALQGSANSRTGAGSIMLEGNEKSFVWSARGSYRNSGAYHTPEEWVYNSSSEEKDGNLFLGINRKWGYSHMHLTVYDAKLGLTEGDRDSLSGNFVTAENEIVPDKFSRSFNLPFQKVKHFKLSSVNSFYFRESNLKFIAGYQENNRSEFEQSEETAGMIFRLRTITGDAKYYFPEKTGWKTVAGITTMLQDNANLGIEFLIPEYVLSSAGAFISVMKTIRQFTWNAGLRMDVRAITGEEKMVENQLKFAALNRNFSDWSGSAGATWQVTDDFNLKLNAGRGFRAPHIAELAANGVHEGTFRYEIGNPDLKSETSLQFDLGANYSRKKYSIEVSAFYNSIDNFIFYDHADDEVKVVDDNNYPVYRFVQGNSALTGFEASLDLHLLERLHFEHTFSYVYAENKSTGKPLPFIPPFRYRPELKIMLAEHQKGRIKESWIKIGADFIGKQDRIDDFETTTPGAIIFNAGAGMSVQCARQWLNIGCSLTNATNVTWYDHMSRLKDAGIASMGQNFVLNINIPFGLRAVK